MSKLYTSALGLVLSSLISLASLGQPTPTVCIPMDGNANDVSGNNHNGIIHGAVLTDDRWGNANSAYWFDGQSDIEISDSIGSYHQSNSLSILFWAKTDSFALNSPFLLTPDDYTDRVNVHINYNHNGSPYCFFDYGNISTGRLQIPSTPFDTVWKHYAVVINSTANKMYIYVNGVLLGSKNGVSALNDRSNTLKIGGGLAVNNTVDCYYHGSIDDVQIYDAPLTETEVYLTYINAIGCTGGAIHNYVTGRAYYDFNQNQVFDSTDVPYMHGAMAETTNQQTFLTFSDGNYIYATDSTGTFEVTPTGLPNYYSAVPATHSATFTALGQSDSLNDFALQAPPVNDLCVNIAPITPFRAGFHCTYKVTYTNHGTTVQSPTVVFYPDTNLTYDSASVAPTFTDPDSTVFSFGPLNPQTQDFIYITVVVDSGLAIGTQLHSSVRIYPLANDTNPICNFHIWEHHTTGSYDPNDIAVDKLVIPDYQAANPPYLTYLIRFQNTGNDTAFTVVVDNTIPNSLDPSTFELLSGSHSVNVSYDNGQSRFRFLHDHILLPDSNINEPGSHGYVMYKIKPYAGLPAGTQISSFANIYFDFNAPVLTNDAITTIVSTVGIPEPATPAGTLLLFPNPANDNVSLLLSKLPSGPATLEVTDLTGKLVYRQTDLSPNRIYDLSLSSYEKGIYLVHLNTSGGTVTRKLVKY